MTTPEGLASLVLEMGLDDWVPLKAIEDLARSTGGDAESEETVHHVVNESIRQLALRGLIQIGEVSDGGFFAWQEPLEQAVARLDRLWSEPPDVRGFACWTSNTATGDRSARQHITK